MKRPGWILFMTLLLTHALCAMLAGTLDPLAWPRFELLVGLFILAPCVGLGIAVLEGAIA